MSPWGETNLIGRVDGDLRNGGFGHPKQCEESLSSPISPNDNIIIAGKWSRAGYKLKHCFWSWMREFHPFGSIQQMANKRGGNK